jgi:uncharacterized protein
VQKNRKLAAWQARFPALLVASWLSFAIAAKAADETASPASSDSSGNVQVLEPLALQGNAVAQFNLGVLHDVGRGVWQDYAAAARWYRLAAKQGHAAAQFNLGGLYFEGLGVTRDLVRASVWFTLAATTGFDGATRNRNSVTTLLTQDQIAAVQHLARACRQNNYADCD